MEYLQYTCLVLAMFAHHASSLTLPSDINIENVYWQELPVCSPKIPIRPCNILMKRFPHGVDRVDIPRSTRPMCLCREGQEACPTAWNADPIRSVTYLLNMGGELTAIQMQFCEPLTPRDPVCEDGDIAVALSGYGAMPVNVQDYNCRCPTDEPLHLANSKAIADRMQQNFTCSASSCRPNDTQQTPCVELLGRDSFHTEAWHYNCECPNGYRCVVNTGTDGQDEHIRGFCQQV